MISTQLSDFYVLALKSFMVSKELNPSVTCLALASEFTRMKTDI